MNESNGNGSTARDLSVGVSILTRADDCTTVYSGSSSTDFTRTSDYTQATYFDRDSPASRGETALSKSSFSPSVVEDISPFKAVTDDLIARAADWKGQPLSGLGEVQMYDIVGVRRKSLSQKHSYFGYMFEGAIVFAEEKSASPFGQILSRKAPRVLRQLLSKYTVGRTGKVAPKLTLKEWVDIENIKGVADCSSADEPSFAIDFRDDKLESISLFLKDQPTLMAWKTHITSSKNKLRSPAEAQPAVRETSTGGASNPDDIHVSSRFFEPMGTSSH